MLKYDELFSQCLQCQGHKKKTVEFLGTWEFCSNMLFLCPQSHKIWKTTQIWTFELNFLALGDFAQISCFPLSLVWKYEKIPKIFPVLLSAMKYNCFENNCDKMGDIISILVSAIKCYFYFRSSVKTILFSHSFQILAIFEFEMDCHMI